MKDPDQTPTVPAPPPEPDPAREFADIVGNMLDDKLHPVRTALQNVASEVVRLHERQIGFEVRVNRKVREYNAVAYVALAIGLVDLGAIVSTLYLLLQRMP